MCVSALGLVSSYRLPAAAFLGFPGGPDRKESACNAGDLGLIPGLGRSPGGEHENPLQYSCLENPIDRGAGGLQSVGRTESDTTEATKHALP